MFSLVFVGFMVDRKAVKVNGQWLPVVVAVVVTTGVVVVAVVHKGTVHDLLGTAVEVKDHVLLEAAGLAEGYAGEVVLGLALGQEADVQTLDVVADVVADGALGTLGLKARIEGSQTVELHGHAAREQFDHAVAEGGQDADDGVAGVGAAVAEDVLGQAAQAQGVHAHHLGVPEQVTVVVLVVHLPEIVLH